MQKKYNILPNTFCRIIICLFVLSSFFFNACRRELKPRCKDCLILNASLDAKTLPMDRLFDKIEIIPIETTDNSLIKFYVYDYLNGKHYILDPLQYILFIFDEKGNYLDRIDKRGQGPDEYTYIYDFTLNPEKGHIEILSPFRFIYCYDFSGNHLKTYDLNKSNMQAPGIRYMQILDDENYVLWSMAAEFQDGISIISQETGELVNSFWRDQKIINTFVGSFYSYNHETYFSASLYNTVYKVTKEGVVEDYEWFFGDKTMDIRRHKISTGWENITMDSENLAKKLTENDQLYECFRHFQNNKYYFLQLRFHLNTLKCLFYDKLTGESCFVEMPTTDSPLGYILYFSDEYMVGQLKYDDKDKLIDSPLLDEANRQKLLHYKADDNPCLVRYYFKANE